jgi:hypothetical protein
MIVVASSTISHPYVNGALLTNRHAAVSQPFRRAWTEVFPTAFTLARLSADRFGSNLDPIRRRAYG